MADNIALTRIKHGLDDGDYVEFEPGEKVTGLPKETMDELREAGAVGAEPVTQTELDAEKEALEARVAELEAQLKQQAKDEKQQPVDPAKLQPKPDDKK